MAKLNTARKKKGGWNPKVKSWLSHCGKIFGHKDSIWKKHGFSLVLAVVIVLLINSVVSERVVPDEVAVVTQVEGAVLIFTAESPAGRTIMNNESISKNDTVEVQENSRLELRLPDNGSVRLSENTSLTMRMPQFEKRTGTLHLQAFLNNGRLWAKMKKRTPHVTWLDVITGTAHVVAKDAVYSVEANEDESTTIYVYEGVVPAVSAARETPRTNDRTSALPEDQHVSVQALQQVSVSAQADVSQQREFDPRTTINDWIRWNLQRDAREELASITLTPVSSIVTRGRTLQFAGVAHYPDKTEKDITWFATWSSSDVNVAKINPSGTVAGIELGEVTISAAIGDMTGSTVLTISRELLSIAVTPASQFIVNGAVQQFRAVGTFSDKSVKDITSSAIWSSSNANVAFVDAGGRAVAGNVAGTAVISASLGTRRGSAALKVRRELVSITIMPESAMIMAGETQRFGAIGSYSDKTSKDLTELVEWETSNASIAAIDQVQAGRVIGNDRAGKATIRASYKGKSGKGTITINTAKTMSSP